MEQKKLYAILTVVVFAFAFTLVGVQAFAGGMEQGMTGSQTQGSGIGAPKDAQGNQIYGTEAQKPMPGAQTSGSGTATMGQPADAQGNQIYGHEPAHPSVETTTAPTAGSSGAAMGAPKDAQGNKIYGQRTEMNKMSGKEAMRGNAQLCRASEVIGLAVEDENGAPIGEVNDLVVDGHGHVQYFLVSHGGAMGMKETKLIPVPYEVAQFNKMGNAIILKNVSRQMLEKAPSFTKAQWKEIQRPEFEKKVYGYYGQEMPR